MSYSDDISFEGDQAPMGNTIGIVRAENKMAAWLMRKGLAKNDVQAQYILLGIAGGAVVVGIMAWYMLSPAAPRLTAQEAQEIQHFSTAPTAPAAYP